MLKNMEKVLLLTRMTGKGSQQLTKNPPKSTNNWKICIKIVVKECYEKESFFLLITRNQRG